MRSWSEVVMHNSNPRFSSSRRTRKACTPLSPSPDHYIAAAQNGELVPEPTPVQIEQAPHARTLRKRTSRHRSLVSPTSSGSATNVRCAEATVRNCNSNATRQIHQTADRDKQLQRAHGGISGRGPLDDVPADLARTVVNMQEYYAAGVEEVTSKLDVVTLELEKAQEENGEMKRRLDMHLVMLQGMVNFMQEVRSGRYEFLTGGVEDEFRRVDDEEGLLLAVLAGENKQKERDIEMRSGGSLGGERSSERSNHNNNNKNNQRGHASTNPSPGREPVPQPPAPLPTPPRSDVAKENSGYIRPDVNMELPPTPTFDGPPVRSTGQRAPRRRAHMTTPPRRPAVAKGRASAPLEDSLVRQHKARARTVPAGDVVPREDDARSSPADGHDRESDSDCAHERGISDGWLAGGRRARRLSGWTPVNALPENMDLEENDGDPTMDYQPDQDTSSSDDDGQDISHHPLPTTPAIRQTTTITATTTSIPSSSPRHSPEPESQSHPPRQQRYSHPRHTTTPRYASGPSPRPFRFHRMGRTVLDVWREYKHGTHGNPSIESLERVYGTGWRSGSLRQVKYASNYVGVRQKVVNKVEEMCEAGGITPEEACRRLDERVDGRMQMLISAVRKGEDPFVVIPRR